MRDFFGGGGGGEEKGGGGGEGEKEVAHARTRSTSPHTHRSLPPHTPQFNPAAQHSMGGVGSYDTSNSMVRPRTLRDFARSRLRANRLACASTWTTLCQLLARSACLRSTPSIASTGSRLWALSVRLCALLALARDGAQPARPGVACTLPAACCARDRAGCYHSTPLSSPPPPLFRTLPHPRTVLTARAGRVLARASVSNAA